MASECLRIAYKSKQLWEYKANAKKLYSSVAVTESKHLRNRANTRLLINHHHC